MINIEDIDFDNFKLGKAGRAVKLLYNKEPIKFCTSLLYSPFGVRSMSKDWSKFDEYTLDCSLNQSQSEQSVAFREFLDKLDVKIKELVNSNLDMFNVKETPDNQLIYNPILRENGTYPKLIKLQLPRDKNGNYESFIFDKDKQKVRITENNIAEVLQRGKIFKCIIECSKLWCYNGKIGSMWNINQLKFADTQVMNSVNANISRVNLLDNNSVYNTLMIDD